MTSYPAIAGTLKFRKIHEGAKLPHLGSKGAIGLDLHAYDNQLLPIGEVTLVPTGLAVEIPNGYYGRIAPRSGWAVKHGIDTLAGVIDSDYRGEINVVLFNNGKCPIDIKAGDRIAQLILERADRFIPVWGDLSDTERGAGGFGSTGR